MKQKVLKQPIVSKSFANIYEQSYRCQDHGQLFEGRYLKRAYTSQPYAISGNAIAMVLIKSLMIVNLVIFSRMQRKRFISDFLKLYGPDMAMYTKRSLLIFVFFTSILAGKRDYLNMDIWGIRIGLYTQEVYPLALPKKCSCHFY